MSSKRKTGYRTGRPPGPTQHYEALTIRIPPELRDQMRHRAIDQGTTVQQMVIDAMRLYLGVRVA